MSYVIISCRSYWDNEYKHYIADSLYTFFRTIVRKENIHKIYGDVACSSSSYVFHELVLRLHNPGQRLYVFVLDKDISFETCCNIHDTSLLVLFDITNRNRNNCISFMGIDYIHLLDLLEKQKEILNLLTVDNIRTGLLYEASLYDDGKTFSVVLEDDSVYTMTFLNQSYVFNELVFGS